MSKEKELIPFYDYVNQIANGMEYSEEFYNKLKKKAKYDLIYKNIFKRLKNIILKLYKWKVPENINPRIIELGLLYNGMLCAYNGPKGSFILPCLPLNSYTVYGDPTQVQVHGFNGYNDRVNIKYDFKSPGPLGVKLETPTKNEGVFMRDNDADQKYIDIIREYAMRLTDKVIARDIAFQRLKSPFTYVVDEKELKDTLEKLVEKIESNDDVIIRLKSNQLGNKEDSVRLEKNQIQPQILSEMRAEVNADINSFLETIGINTNPSPDKSQVVLTPELESNNSLIDIEQDVRFLNRKQFCKDCKKIGIKISVEKNIDEVKQEANKLGKEIGGENNDNIDRE